MLVFDSLYCKQYGPCTDPVVRGTRGSRTPPPPPLENHKFIGFPSNTGLDPLTIIKLPSQHSMWATISAAQRNSISVLFRWKADNCLLLEPCSPKTTYRVGPSLTKFSGSMHDHSVFFHNQSTCSRKRI